MIKNHYDILGISRKASTEDVKTAYRKLAVKFHPDKNEGEAFFSDLFRQINEAYNTLSDPVKRAVYDKELYSFENPARPGDSFKKASASNFNNNNVTPKPSTYTRKSSVWDGVREWRKVRNFMLVGDLILLMIFFLSNSTKQHLGPEGTDTTFKHSPIVKRSRKHKKSIRLDTIANLPIVDSIQTKENIVKQDTINPTSVQ